MPWRGFTHLDNRNRVVNNNTKMRILGVNQPVDERISPLEEMGYNKNWSERQIDYVSGNPGIITKIDE